MIKGYCRTNIDDWKGETWPTEFVAVPRVGECVRAKSGKYLKVVRVTHYIEYENHASKSALYPAIEVELNLY